MSKRTRHNPQGLKQQSLKAALFQPKPDGELEREIFCKPADKQLLSPSHDKLEKYFLNYKELAEQISPNHAVEIIENKRVRIANQKYTTDDEPVATAPLDLDGRGADEGKLQSAGQAFADCLQLIVSRKDSLSLQAQSYALYVMCFADLHPSPEVALKVARILHVHNQRHPLSTVVEQPGGFSYIRSADSIENTEGAKEAASFGAWNPMRGAIYLPTELKAPARERCQRFSALMRAANLALMQVKAGTPDVGGQLIWRYLVGLVQQDLGARLSVLAQYAGQGAKHGRAAEVLLEQSLLWRLLQDDGEVWREGERSKVHLLQVLVELVLAARALPEDDGGLMHMTQHTSQGGPPKDDPAACPGPTQLLMNYSPQLKGRPQAGTLEERSSAWLVSPAELCDLGRQLLHCMLNLFGSMEAAGRYNGGMLKANDRLEMDRWLMKWIPDGLPELKGNAMRLHLLGALPVRDRARLLWIIIANTKSEAWQIDPSKISLVFQHTYEYVKHKEASLLSPCYHEAQPTEALEDMLQLYSWYTRSFGKFARQTEELHDGFYAMVACFVSSCAELLRTNVLHSCETPKFKQLFTSLQNLMSASPLKQPCMDTLVAMGKAAALVSALDG